MDAWYSYLAEHVLVNASFLRHQFDEHGLWDTNEKDQRMRGAMEAVSAVGKGVYIEEISIQMEPDC